MIETNDVIAAKNTKRKKNAATALAPKYPIDPCNARNIFGRNVKISDTELSLNSAVFTLGLNENTAGRIIKPAVKATAVSVSATNFAEFTMSVYY